MSMKRKDTDMVDETIDAPPPEETQDTNVQDAPPTVTDETNFGGVEPVEEPKGKTLDEIAADDPEAFWNPGRVLPENESK